MTRSTEALLFRVGNELFAVELAEVEEAVDLETVESVAGARASMVGVFEHRGALVPLYSPAEALNVSGSEARTALIIRTPGECVALAVDDVLDAVSLDPAEMRQLSGSASDHVFRGIVRLGESLIGVVDLHALIAACRGATDQEIQ
jgi:purine-binding chemotaxis protein CheW